MKSFLQLCGEDARILMSYRARADFEAQFFEDAAIHFTITEIARVTREDAWFEFRDVCGADVVVFEMRRKRVAADTALDTSMPAATAVDNPSQPLSGTDDADEPAIPKKSRISSCGEDGAEY